MAVDVLAALRSAPDVAIVLDALGDRDDVRVVGGAVRDTLLAVAPRDLDLVVAGDAATLAAELGEVVAVHEQFNTAEARVGELDVGVAGARIDHYPLPGALPDVEPASLDDDLGRRDFSINAISVGLDGALHGVDGWRRDIDERRLRVLHVGSFIDDPTRLWRAARYAARLRLGLDPDTERLAAEAVACGALATVSGARLGGELELALREPDPAAALTAAVELGLLPAGAGTRRALVEDALELGGTDVEPGLVALAAICSGVAPQRLRDWLESLAIPARKRDVVVEAVRLVDALSARLEAASSPSQIADAARGHRAEVVALAGALHGEDSARAWLRELRHVRLAIDGRDLIAAGIAAGPELGERLALALRAKLDGEAVGRDAELAVALGPRGGGAVT